jgi:hypothetical protein
MLNRSLIIIHDGSYMKEISPLISSAATMIYCTIAKELMQMHMVGEI